MLTLGLHKIQRNQARRNIHIGTVGICPNQVLKLLVPTNFKPNFAGSDSSAAVYFFQIAESRRWVAMYFSLQRTHTRTSKIVPQVLAHAPRFLGDRTRTHTFHFHFFYQQFFCFKKFTFFYTITNLAGKSMLLIFSSRQLFFFLKRNHSLSMVISKEDIQELITKTQFC